MSPRQIENTIKARYLVELITQELLTVRLGVRTTGYRLYHLAKAYENLCDFNYSLKMYAKAYQYAEETNFNQLLGLANSGIARIYKHLREFTKAIQFHEAAILILKKISDIPSLAEAYFQLGLTYQAMEEHDQAETYKAKALKLFEQMEAPKQIERVKQAFEQGAKQ